jgi:hypothetical protein
MPMRNILSVALILIVSGVVAWYTGLGDLITGHTHESTTSECQCECSDH